MNRRDVVSILGMMLFALGLACAQDQDNAPSSDSQPPQQPVPAYGQDNAPKTPISENPPLSGIDLPSLQEHAAPVSFLKPGATFSENVTNNLDNTFRGNYVGSRTRALGTLTLRRLWSHYDLALDYMGGADYYKQANIGWRLNQALGVDQKIEWKRGQLELRDNFSYAPEGGFGGFGGYGSLGSVGIGGIGSAPGGLWGGQGGLAALGLAPRITNVSLAEVSENLSPRSALTASGGYAFTHFLGNNVGGGAFLGSSQITAQAGYNRTLTSHTQIAATYAYQSSDFSVLGTAFHSHIVQAMYGHRISGRLDLLLGAGPEITVTNSLVPACSDPSISDPLICLLLGDQVVTQAVRSTRLGATAQARLRYQFPKSSLELSYERFISTGGGIFAGATSDMVRVALQRPLSRIWSLSADVNAGHHDRLQGLTLSQLTACGGASQGSLNACPANNAASYVDVYAGAAVHRYFGRTFHGFLSYQFTNLSFHRSFCIAGTRCNRITSRQIVTVGLDWTPRPIRLD